LRHAQTEHAMQKAYALFWGTPARTMAGLFHGPPAAIDAGRLRAAHFFESFFTRNCSSFSAIFISSPLLTGR